MFKITAIISGEGAGHGNPDKLRRRFAWEAPLKGTAKDYRGRKIVLGKPHEPGWNWTCGTDVVWPVIEVEGEGPIGVAGVCRHQILVGD